MSSVKYQKAYDGMTEKQRQIMANLYMKGINHDGHSWNTYGDIEDAVADLYFSILDQLQELAELQEQGPLQLR